MPEQSPTKNRKRKQVTLYDAVAGRVGYEGFLTEPKPSKFRDTGIVTSPAELGASTTTHPLPADEILFQRKHAPLRYAEHDIYAADSKLPLQGAELPSTELLKALHAYTSDFYGSTGDGGYDFGSLDETALLALGILVEEAAKEVLGENGDLAFTVLATDEVERSGSGGGWGGRQD